MDPSSIEAVRARIDGVFARTRSARIRALTPHHDRDRLHGLAALAPPAARRATCGLRYALRW